MMNFTVCFLLFVSIVSTVSTVVLPFKRVCYISIDHYPFTDESFGGFNTLLSKGFSPDLCTHINILPSIIQNNFTLSLSEKRHLSLINEIKILKTFNPEIKLLTTLLPDPYLMSDTLNSQRSSQLFAKSIIHFINEMNLDGIDLDWEFPTYTTRRLRDKWNFINFIQLLRSMMDSTNNEHLLITAAVAVDPTIINFAYDIPKLNELLDFVNLMTYDFLDFHVYYPFVSLNAPFYPFTNIPYFNRLNVVSAVNHWINSGLHRSKLIVGIPTYAHTFELFDGRLNRVTSPAIKGGPSISFSEVCLFLRQKGTKDDFHEAARVPFAYNNSIWVSYENKKSAYEKTKWIKEQSLGGVMTFNINNDDYLSVCSTELNETFPLHNIIYDTLKG